MHESTLRDWMAKDVAFKTQVKAAREAAFAEAMHRIQALTTQAVETLSMLLRSGPPAVRLGAARSVLELGVHRHEAEFIERRIGDMETRISSTEKEGK